MLVAADKIRHALGQRDAILWIPPAQIGEWAARLPSRSPPEKSFQFRSWTRHTPVVNCQARARSLPSAGGPGNQLRGELPICYAVEMFNTAYAYRRITAKDHQLQDK